MRVKCSTICLSRGRRVRVQSEGEREGGRVRVRRRAAGADDGAGGERRRRGLVPGGVGVAAVQGRRRLRRRRQGHQDGRLPEDPGGACSAVPRRRPGVAADDEGGARQRPRPPRPGGPRPAMPPGAPSLSKGKKDGKGKSSSAERPRKMGAPPKRQLSGLTDGNSRCKSLDVTFFFSVRKKKGVMGGG